MSSKIIRTVKQKTTASEKRARRAYLMREIGAAIGCCSIAAAMGIALAYSALDKI